MTKEKNLVSTKKETVYKFVGELRNSSYPTLEAALESRKGKTPANGKTWEIEAVTTEVKHYSFESEKQCSDNPEITKRIIDYFCEHATPDNVKLDVYTHDGKYVANPEYRQYYFDIADRLHGFFCCHHYFGWTFKQYLKEWNSITKRAKEGRKYFYEGNTTSLLMCRAMKDEFHIKPEDLEFHVTNGEYWGEICEYDINGLDKKYPGLYNALKKRWDPLYMTKDIDGSDFWLPISKQEILDEYKQLLKETPIEEFEWEYNTGDYKPCNNYKLDFKKKVDYKKYKVFGGNVQGIMFRNEDIYITYDDYIGRHVNKRASAKVDVNEKLYEYCIKNLK